MNNETDIKKEFVLDYERWICGGGNVKTVRNFLIGHGAGGTALLNDDGFMCCLGQFSLQCGAKIQDIIYKTAPRSVDLDLVYLNERFTPLSEKTNTDFSNRAIEINDNELTNVVEKIISLQELCEEYDFSLQVINLPQNIKNKINEKSND